MSTSLEQIVARVRRLEAGLKRATTTPQLAYSSVEDGAIDVNNVEGVQVMVIGKQYDGTNTTTAVNGPLPPVPSGLTVAPGVSSLIGEWDGTWVDGAVAPMDFARIEFHVTATPGAPLDLVGAESTTLRGAVESARGGRVVMPLTDYAEHYVRMVAWTESGKFGDPSLEVAGTPAKIETIDIAPLSITGDQIADFALAVTKINSTNHMIY